MVMVLSITLDMLTISMARVGAEAVNINVE